MPASLNFAQDPFDTCGPSVGDRIAIPRGQELIDGAVQFVHVAKGTPPDGLLFELRKPPFDEVEPARACRDKVQHEARTLLKPGTDPLVAMDGIVVEDQV